MIIKGSVSSKRVQAMLGRIPARLDIELFNALRDVGETHLTTMKRRMQGRMAFGPQMPGGSTVRTSTGALSKSFVRVGPMQSPGASEGAQLEMRLFSAGVRYANIQEFGGTIKPVNGRYLAIPMPAIRRANGSIIGKYSGGPRSLMGEVWNGEAGQSLTFVFKSPKSKKLFIVERTTKGLKFLWMLKESVTLKGGLGWFDTWLRAEPERQRRLALALKRGVNGTGSGGSTEAPAS